MKVIGPLTPELAAQMGSCEVCGAAATNLVRDFLEITKFGYQFVDRIEPLKLHRFCEAHNRDARFVQVVDEERRFL